MEHFPAGARRRRRVARRRNTPRRCGSKGSLTFPDGSFSNGMVACPDVATSHVLPPMVPPIFCRMRSAAGGTSVRYGWSATRCRRGRERAGRRHCRR